MDAFMAPMDVEPLARHFVLQVQKRFGCHAEDGAWRDDEVRTAAPDGHEHQSMTWLGSR